MPRVNTFVAEPFTNKIGQVLQPGDRVVAVTSSWDVSVYTGVYEGVFKDKNGRVTGTRVGKIPQTRYNKVYRDNGKYEESKYVKTGEKDRWGWEIGKYVPTGRRYDFEPYDGFRTTALQRNRLFRVDTTLEEVKGDLV